MFQHLILGLLWIKRRWPACDATEFDCRLVSYHGCLSHFHPLVERCPQSFDGSRYGRMMVSKAESSVLDVIASGCGAVETRIFTWEQWSLVAFENMRGLRFRYLIGSRESNQ